MEKSAPTARMRLVPASTLLLAALLAVAGCGSSKSSTASSATSPATTSAAAPPATSPATTSTGATSSTGAASLFSLAANPEGLLKFDKSSLTAKAGSVSISFTNSSAVSHNLTVASASGAVIGATPSFQGGTRVLPLRLKPGTYKFYCSVPGHQAAGMEGTITVQ